MHVKRLLFPQAISSCHAKKNHLSGNHRSLGRKSEMMKTHFNGIKRILRGLQGYKPWLFCFRSWKDCGIKPNHCKGIQEIETFAFQKNRTSKEWPMRLANCMLSKFSSKKGLNGSWYHMISSCVSTIWFHFTNYAPNMAFFNSTSWRDQTALFRATILDCQLTVCPNCINFSDWCKITI